MTSPMYTGPYVATRVTPDVCTSREIMTQLIPKVMELFSYPIAEFLCKHIIVET